MRIYKINEFEKIVSEDLNDLQKAIHQSLYDKILYPLLQRQDGFLGDSFLVERVDSSSVSIRAGRGFMYDASQVSPNPKYQAVQLNNDTTLTLGVNEWDSAPSAPNNRIDIIVVRSKEVVVESQSRFIKTAGTGPIVSQTVDKITEQLVEIDVVEGEPDLVPVAPATPAGWLKIAEVYVTGGTGINSSNDITDSRQVLLPGSEGGFHQETRYVDPLGQGTDSTLASAISNLPPEGGSIFIMSDVTVAAPVVLPANTVLKGRSTGSKITVTDSGSITLSDDCLVENLTIESTEAIEDILIPQGDRVAIREIIYEVPSTSVEKVDTRFQKIIPVSANHDLRHLDSGSIILVDTSGGELSLNLPEPKDGVFFHVKDAKGSFGSEKCTLVPYDTEEIEGLATSYKLESPFGSWTVLSDGTDWFLI